MPGSPRSFAQFSMSQRLNDHARGEPGDKATFLEGSVSMFTHVNQLVYSWELQQMLHWQRGLWIAMATAKFSQLDTFNPDVDYVTAFIERVHLLFAANNIPNKKAVAVFLSTIGGKTSTLLQNFISPEHPETLKVIGAHGHSEATL